MIKKTITFEDYDGNAQSIDCYFHLTEVEQAELNFSYKGGLAEHVKSIVAAEDNYAIMQVFKKLILASYGKRTDSCHFVKSPEQTAEFMQTPAYSALFMELAGDENKAAAFMNGLLPAKKNTPAPASI